MRWWFASSSLEDDDDATMEQTETERETLVRHDDDDDDDGTTPDQEPPSSSSVSASPPPFSSWNDALYQTCVASASLSCTVRQVLEYTQTECERPRRRIQERIQQQEQEEQEGTVLVLATTSSTSTSTCTGTSTSTTMDATAARIAAAIRQGRHDRVVVPPTVSSSSSPPPTLVLSRAPRAIYTVMTWAWGTVSSWFVWLDNDEFMTRPNRTMEWNQVQDDFTTTTTATTTTMSSSSASWRRVDYEDRLVCVPLVQQCVEYLVHRHSFSSSSVVVLLRHASSSSSTNTTTTPTWSTWCRQENDNHLWSHHDDDNNNDETSSHATTTATRLPLKRLSWQDLDLLASVLVELGHAEEIKERNLLLLLLMMKQPNAPRLTDSERQVHVALVQLQQAIDDTECQIAKWTAVVDDCTQRAVRCKQQQYNDNNNNNNHQAALMQLRKRQLFRNKIELSQATLLKLHQAQLELDSARVHQTQVLEALRTTTGALKQLRLETAPSVQQVTEELREELEHATTQSHVVLSSVQSVVSREEEDELMRELQNLVLKDEEEDTNGGSDKARKSNVSFAGGPLSLPEAPTHLPTSKRAPRAIHS